MLAKKSVIWGSKHGTERDGCYMPSEVELRVLDFTQWVGSSDQASGEGEYSTRRQTKRKGDGVEDQKERF